MAGAAEPPAWRRRPWAVCASSSLTPAPFLRACTTSVGVSAADVRGGSRHRSVVEGSHDGAQLAAPLTAAAMAWGPPRRWRASSWPPPEPTPPRPHERLLAELPAGSHVAVVMLRGSLCPVTLGHIQGFIEARRILLKEDGVKRPARLEWFSEVLGFLSLNTDKHVACKLSGSGESYLNFEERRHLITVATAEHPWLGPGEDRKYQTFMQLVTAWPELHFVHFYLNGADDVVKYRKYQCDWQDRYIAMGRPGYTEKLLLGMQHAGVDPQQGYFVVGPELPDISATAARRALREGDEEALRTLLHPGVTDWCSHCGAGKEAAAAAAAAVGAAADAAADAAKPRGPASSQRAWDTTTQRCLRNGPYRPPRRTKRKKRRLRTGRKRPCWGWLGQEEAAGE